MFRLLLLLFMITQAAFGIDLSLEPELIFSGPNCHNTALRAANLMQVKRYVREDEMTQILNTYCQEIDQDNAQFGVIFTHPNNRPMHSFNHLENNKVLTKNGVSKRAQIEVQNFQSMYRIHESAIKNDCRIKKIPTSQCQLKVSYFKCNAIEAGQAELALDFFYDQRELIFEHSNQMHIANLLSQEFSTNNSKQFCPRFLSIYQSLDIMNWNSLGPEEYNQMKAFLEELKLSEQYRFCIE